MSTFPPQSLLQNIRRVRVYFKVPRNENLLPITGWKLQVEEILRRHGLQIAPHDESNISAAVEVWISVLNVCTINGGTPVYSFNCAVTTMTNIPQSPDDLVIVSAVSAHNFSEGHLLVPTCEEALMDITTSTAEMLKK